MKGIWAYKKTMMTKSVSIIKEINQEAEEKFGKKAGDVSEGSSSEEEALPNKKLKGKNLVGGIKSSDDNKEDKKVTAIRRQ